MSLAAENLTNVLLNHLSEIVVWLITGVVTTLSSVKVIKSQLNGLHEKITGLEKVHERDILDYGGRLAELRSDTFKEFINMRRDQNRIAERENECRVHVESEIATLKERTR